MDVLEIAAGFWRWTGWRSEWKEEVGCVYHEAAGAVVLIDPLLPPEDADRFGRALDRDIERAGLPVHVLITIFWHSRSAGELARRYGGRLWAPSRSRAPIERRTQAVTDVFHIGDVLPGGVEVFPTARATEVVFWLPEHRALVTGDVILGAKGVGLRLCPQSWLPAGIADEALRESLLPLLELPVERVLVSHGDPVLEHGHRALEQLLA